MKMSARTLCVTCQAHSAIPVELVHLVGTSQQVFLPAVLRTGHWVQWAPVHKLPKILVFTPTQTWSHGSGLLALTEPTFGSFCVMYVAEVTFTA